VSGSDSFGFGAESLRPRHSDRDLDVVESGGMRTPVCEVLGIDVPLICAPFGPWDEVELAAAVCAAGGLGSLGTAVKPLPELQAQWARLVQRTDRPFAINHTTRPFDPAAFDATLEFGPAAISFHMGDPGELVERAHRAGILWIQQVMDVEQARQAVARGVDVIVAQGGEAGGHGGFVSTMVLVPQVVDVAGNIPVVAAGGIADGRGLAAALALGAQGAVMGTRFLASEEMTVSPDWKRMIVEADAADALKAETLDLLLPPYTRPHYPAVGRVLRTPFYDQWANRPDQLAEHAAHIGPEILQAIQAGNGHEYLPFAGQSAGLVHEILPAREIVRRVVAEADQILRGLSSTVCSSVNEWRQTPPRAFTQPVT
jgi:nitronate monooxygenase/enoyl-[acyl-carrier protein] reductase II